ncbi:hypothetical protein EDB85DRAFT_2160198 [Lactarius pseudohatsudake]|nr:hypothetical protein EDB85DRAFT_2160198 [Lactarius pseudohatsudake]
MHDDFDDVFNQDNLPPPGLCLDSRFDYDEDKDEHDDFVGTQHALRHPLRSRPPIDFAGAGRCSANTGVPAFSAATRPPSHMSDATLHSSLGFLAPHTFPYKTSSSPRPSPDVIASLNVAELCYNPHYLKLHEKFDQVCRALAMKTIEGGFTPTDTLVPDSYQAPPLRTKESCASSLGLHAEESRASSLGPSDSTSQQQQMKFDPAYDKAIGSLLETVELLPTWPQYLVKEVLWYSDDCATDKTYGDIITAQNQYRPKMNLAIRRPNGSKVSNQEFSNIQRSTNIAVQKLINLVDSDPMHAGKSQTKMFIITMFKTEYDQAILELEAEHKLLRLCYAHWKADNLLGQKLQRRSDAKKKAACAASSIPPDDTSEPFTAPIPQVWDAAPVNAAKRAFELSPGPKSPSASQAQKRSKDGIALSKQKTTGPSVPSNPPPRARKLVPTFLSHTKVTNTESPSTNLRPVFVDPSADNLIAVLTSDFPSLTNAVTLIRSMNVQILFKQGKSSNNVTTLLERVQFADPGSPDIDEDNMCLSWGHDLFTAGGISPSSSLTTWEDVGSVATAFKLVAAALKTCQEARLMCTNAGTPKTSGFISDVYLEKILECLEGCWVGAGGAITSSRVPVLPTTPPTLSDRDAAMSPPKRGILLKIKRPMPVADDITPTTPAAPTENDSTSAQQPAARTGPTQEPSVALDEGTRADAASLKDLHVAELLTWLGNNKLSAPKSKRKDDLIAAIVKSSEFAQVSKSAIQEIIQNRKMTKGSKKQLAAALP